MSAEAPVSRNARPALEIETEETSCPWCDCRRGTVVSAPGELVCWAAPEKSHPFAFKRCERCALVYLQPRPTNLDEVYREDYHAHTAGGESRGRFKRWSRRMLMRLFMNYPPPPPFGVAGFLRRLWAERWKKFEREHGHLLVPWAGSGQGRLLDVGSGAGGKLHKYREMGWQVTGVESDAQAARTARETFHLDVREGFLEAQGFPAGSFDAITLNFVLEHVPDPRGLLTHCHRLLAPEGFLLVDVPNFDSALRPIFGPCWTQYGLPEHWLLPTDATLRMMVSECGFAVDKVLHRGSVGLYRVAHQRARETGCLPAGLPDPADKQALSTWFADECAAPHGELMLLFARRE